jgi:hypothetical protein
MSPPLIRVITTFFALFAALTLAGGAAANPVVPPSDDTIVEQLPARVFGVQPLREVEQSHARDPHAAAERARKLLDEARDRGDPRYAGYALAAIAPWKEDKAAPAELVVLRATLAQYQHDFDGSRALLEQLLVRDPGDAQALLTLATIARVQGRYDDSDATCRKVPARLYAIACLAENLALRGKFDEARRALDALLTTQVGAGSDGDAIRRWLDTTRAELEERAADPVAAQHTFTTALQGGRDAYLQLDYADFLLDAGKPDDATRALAGEPQPLGDGVLLRLAIAARARQSSDAKALADELRSRFDAARERGDAISIHGRELARFIDEVDGHPRDAIAIARDNLRIQKEPADFLVMAHAARAAGDRTALREVADAARAIGLVDRRLDALTKAP